MDRARPASAAANRGDHHAALRLLPSVEELAQRLQGLAAFQSVSKAALHDLARGLLHAAREEVVAGHLGAEALAARFAGKGLQEAAQRRAPGVATPYHVRVLNATGVVLHTGIGRAPLGPRAIAALQAAAGVARVEVDAVTGERGQREDAVAALLTALTGAEAALAVNNNAAACVLALSCLARGRQVVVSRGELVEIGGSFRMPEVMATAGCKLVEVGSTNRTHLRDYEAAIGSETALLLKVHPSNYRIVGFTGTPTLAELVAVGKKRGVPVMEDLGSGLLCGDEIAALREEPRVQDSVKSGADLVCFSGDKLLGGPQAGILLGSREVIRRLRQDPLYRALRLDKLVLAALEATLSVYRDGVPVEELPTLSRIAEPVAAVRTRAQRLLEQLTGRGVDPTCLQLTDSEGYAGSGSNPARPIPSAAVALQVPKVAAFGETLRLGTVPVHARVQDGKLLLDARTLGDDEVSLVAECVAHAWRSR